MEHRLKKALLYAKKYLPSQGPLEYFVHHNTLHSFEDHPFYDALNYANSLLGAKTKKSLRWYQKQYRAQRITDADLEFSIREKFPQDLDFVKSLIFWDDSYPIKKDSLKKENFINSFSWKEEKIPEPFKRIYTHWDFIPKHATKIDLEESISLRRTKFLTAYFDKGLAYWQMEERDSGLLSCFTDYVKYLPPFNFSGELKKALEKSNADEKILTLLASLHVPEQYFEAFIFETLYRVKGWSALVLSLEKNPHYNPTNIVVDFEEFLIINLVFELASFEFLKRKKLVKEFEYHLKEPTKFNQNSFAAYLFDQNIKSIDEKFFHHFNEETIFQIWHDAYEFNLAFKTLITIKENKSKKLPVPKIQVVTCIDDREESTRRYFEEIDENIETFGYAGHFGLNILYQGKGDAHFRPLCPVGVTPEHYSWEEANLDVKKLGKLKHFFFHYSKMPLLGGAISLAVAPLVVGAFFLDIFFPHLGHKVRDKINKLFSLDKNSVLNYQQTPDRKHRGFTLNEMSSVVGQMLKTIALTKNFSPIIFICGHGSQSMNNPHEAAHDCGACGGGRGFPNARIFAHMANRKDVRELLTQDGIKIPPEVVFVPGYHNTCNDDILIFDQSNYAKETIKSIQNLAQKVSQLDAKERVRKFEDVSLNITPTKALAHVQARAFNISQPRPEYGHATNAICVIGKRSLTKGIYFDRRAFLVSYDEQQDHQGEIFDSLLASIVPVCAGINLEYYFSYVDREIFGSGVKQPHNITSLMAVMNGYKSDLRLGLPWQMVDIHEPVRILLVFETTQEKFHQALKRASKATKNLVLNEWVKVGIASPQGEVFIFSNQRFIKIENSWTPKSYKSSLAFFNKKREILDFGIVG